MRGGKRPGAGRKPVGDGATNHLNIRISNERLTAYKEAAARHNKTLTEWVQLHLDPATKK